MIRYYMEKKPVQYATLIALTLIMGYYWGFVFEFGYTFDWSVLFTVNETYQEHMGWKIVHGLGMTMKITMISSALALSLGILFGLMRISHFRPMRIVASAYVEFFRNTPLLIQLFFWYFAMPMALPETLREWLFAQEFEFWSATLGLAVYTSAFMAEIIRAGLQAIPRGLLEAAYSSGLTYPQVMRKIILPIAFRNIIPPLGSEFLNNMKNSSLAMVVGVAELAMSSQDVESLTFKGFEATTAASVLYLSLSLVISAILNSVNSRMRMDSKAQHSMGERIGVMMLEPFVMLWVFCTKPLSWLSHTIRASRISRQSKVLSSRRLVFNKFAATVVKICLLAGKASFILLILLTLVLIGKGLMTYDWQVVWDNLPSMLWWRFPNGDSNEALMGLGGLGLTIVTAVLAITVSFPIGLLVGLGRTSRNALFKVPCTIYIEVIRGNPLIMVIFWIYFFIPIVTGVTLATVWSGTVAVIIFTGAYLAEIVRGGIQNIPPGQFEAAKSTGLSYWQTMRIIILPQALKQMIPAIVGQFISIFKDTSLLYIIGVLELTFVAQGINNRLMVNSFEIFTTVAVLYFLCCYAMSRYAAYLENKLTPDGTRLEM